MRRSCSRSGISVLLLTGTGILPLAQQTASAQSQGETGSAGQLEEVIVTGQRREERLQDAAVAVSAFTAESLENAGVRGPGDVLQLTPNVTFVQSNHPGEFYVTVRGNTQTRLGESSVALVVDGVQQLDQNAVNQELFEVEQIEVLKGPQGALYGRNAIGGAIVVRTREPSFDGFEGRVRAGVGNGEERMVQGALSGPLGSDRLAFRVGAIYREMDGFYRNDITGEQVDRRETSAGFLRTLWRPSDRLTGDFRVSGLSAAGGGINWNAILVLPPEFGGNAPVMSGDNTELPYVNNIRGFSNNSRGNASMKWDFELGPATLISTSSWARIKDNYGSDSYPYFNDPGLFYVFFPDDTPVGLGAQTQELQRISEILSQELRLQSSTGGRINWMIGAYFANFDIENRATTGADTDGVLLRGLGPYPFGSQNQTLGYLHDDNDNDAYAFFGNVAWLVTDALELTFSLRYDHEEKSQTDLAFPGAPEPADPKALPTWQIQPWRSREATFSETQPKFAVRYTFSPDISAYASWGRGFKTGGFNPFGTGELLRQFNPASTVEDVFPKEVAETWELGFKSAWFNRRLLVNGAYFRTDTENSQLLEFFPQATLQAISTADEVEMHGFEIDFTALIFDRLQLFGSYGYLDTEVTRFAANPATVGNPRPSTSPYTSNVGLQWSQPLAQSGLSFVARADYTRQGKTTWDWIDTPGAARSPFDLVNARLALQAEQWEVAAWGKNLGDTAYNAEHIVLLPFAGALFRAPPRQYGLEATYRF